MSNYKIFLKEFTALPSLQELATFILKNTPADYDSNLGYGYLRRSSVYCDMRYDTFRNLYLGNQTHPAPETYIKLVKAWIKLHILIEDKENNVRK